MDRAGHARVAARLGDAFHEILVAAKDQRVTRGQRDEWDGAFEAAQAANLPDDMRANAINDARARAGYP
jgi:hypothetical protein